MENESADCVMDAETSFKSFNVTWDQVRVIIVGKDFGKISLLQAAFPGARILLCVFHGVEYLHGETAKKENSIQDRDKVEDEIHMMLNATTEAEYETARRYLYYVVDGKELHSKRTFQSRRIRFSSTFMTTGTPAGICGVASVASMFLIWGTPRTTG
ncbi:hypothetical protein JG688_00016300 [Phytophthora aleatoria]|uniref:ZSWIM1/3 RNaseH-like domain-containing protein n=1 Tax=Phytophthora aleatoria TaxID=2496075 RepID=A0A8J5IS54_9STRA|nr:hypothetical protein JG688_00016300 [Phytophthora aleatoria]